MITLQTIDIGDVKQQSGLPASTLRYYEEKGLIQSVYRKGLRRQYDRKVLEQLDFINLGRKAGFTLDEIAKMFNSTGDYQVNRDSLLAKADQIEQRIKELNTIKKGLLHAANCSAPSHRECPKFQKLLKQASGQQRAALR